MPLGKQQTKPSRVGPPAFVSHIKASMCDPADCRLNDANTKVGEGCKPDIKQLCFVGGALSYATCS